MTEKTVHLHTITAEGEKIIKDILKSHMTEAMFNAMSEENFGWFFTQVVGSANTNGYPYLNVPEYVTKDGGGYGIILPENTVEVFWTIKEAS
jgi:hypothetical protein